MVCQHLRDTSSVQNHRIASEQIINFHLAQTRAASERTVRIQHFVQRRHGQHLNAREAARRRRARARAVVRAWHGNHSRLDVHIGCKFTEILHTANDINPVNPRATFALVIVQKCDRIPFAVLAQFLDQLHASVARPNNDNRSPKRSGGF